MEIISKSETLENQEEIYFNFINSLKALVTKQGYAIVKFQLTNDLDWE
jgi:hypothetical protein